MKQIIELVADRLRLGTVSTRSRYGIQTQNHLTIQLHILCKSFLVLKPHWTKPKSRCDANLSFFIKYIYYQINTKKLDSRKSNMQLWCENVYRDLDTPCLDDHVALLYQGNVSTVSSAPLACNTVRDARPGIMISHSSSCGFPQKMRGNINKKNKILPCLYVW